ncbi:MAG: peptide-methionine (S)-S-oxide reductase MsrA [Gemmatimonadaceae bacterium]|nr:peptide-methionine (S)-S-oxide reductase MsrA [Gemmatimonadaceae bacterium]
MSFSTARVIAIVTTVTAGVLFTGGRLSASRALSFDVPNAEAAEPLASVSGKETAVFAGGCFWGIDAVFRHVKGVSAVSSGYAGGTRVAPDYEQVSSGTTGHTESVQVIFDPSVVTYSQLLQVFFSVHNPTELNRQGPDHGTQYRSAVFYTSDSQKKAVDAYIAQMAREKTFKDPIVTQVAPLAKYWAAEEYHQNYFAQHPNQPYIVINDAPKVALLKKRFPSLYKESLE